MSFLSLSFLNVILTLSPYLWLRKTFATSSFTEGDAERGQLSEVWEERTNQDEGSAHRAHQQGGSGPGPAAARI